MPRKKQTQKPGRASKQKSRQAVTQKPLKQPVQAPDQLSTTLEEPEELDEGLFPIVGIGASAGGLEAFTEMLQNLPSDTGMAFVFVQHLDPKHVSMLTELLQRHSSMPVLDVTNNLRVEPNQVYVIPRNAHMSLVRGVLTLSPRVTAPSPHMTIDPFLRSLASDQKGKAIGIILSGNASDGALGMMAIKASGGITFAQTVESAKHDGMPRAVIATGSVDFVLTPKEIAKELVRLGRHPYITPSRPADAPRIQPAEVEAVNRIVSLLRNAQGVDFSHYKTSTIRRRILRRMALRRIDTLDRYVASLRSDSSELRSLYEDILINVTEFFRDPEAFNSLKKIVFPKISSSQLNSPIRIWVPGCSSGEEVYSIAIALIEFLEEHSHEINIQIFGTDISDVALEKARSGVYSPSIAQDISTERLRRFFTKVDSSYQISKRVRELCVFARQNLVKDPPFSKLDLISCRNVLIYLGTILQKRVIPTFHNSLKPDGFLLLGTSETVGSFSDLFTVVDKKSKLYARLASSRRAALHLQMDDRDPEKPENALTSDTWNEAELLREADRIVLGKYAPAGVVVDEESNIVQFRGRTSPYLEQPPGMASLNLLKMVREGLLVELRNALHKAKRENTMVRAEGLQMRGNSGFVDLSIEVIPFKRIPGRGHRYLVLFEQTRSVEPQRAGKKSKKRPTAGALERVNAQLRQELAATKEYLQSIIEEHESANEELRSANEEIQSSNEELQSTNEELETTKEELQSTNEELNTVNEELQTRNVQLARSGYDSLNLLSNLNLPIVMLGNDLRIQRFTPVSQRLLNLIPTDVGRPIRDINLNLDFANLDRHLAEVVETLTPKLLEVQDLTGRPYSLRIRPYRTEENKIEGVVMLLLDVDPARMRAEAVAEEAVHKSASDEALARNDELRAFSAGLLIAQENERHNLSLELHDDFAQRLALLELNVQTLERAPRDSRRLNQQLRSLREQIAALSRDSRRLAYQLHPSALEDLGLSAALESYIRDFGEREKIQIKYHYSNVPSVVDGNTSLGVYRVLQESLRNVARHSGARAAEVSLIGRDGNIQLIVRDDGSGFNLDAARRKGGLGLRSMEARVRLLGGSIEIRSKIDEGTEVVVLAPKSRKEDAT